jgi:uncharacterized protein with PIN domain
LELFLLDARIEIVPFDSRRCDAAILAWRKYGKGETPGQVELAASRYRR